jgi:hypothetical protein
LSSNIRTVALFTVIAGSLLPASNALGGGPYTDELSKCLVRSSTPADKSVLVQWMFSTLVLHPDVAPLASVPDSKRTAISQSVAQLFERLIVDSCRVQTQEAIRYEGAGAIDTSFSVLGQVAARELFLHPKVAAAMADLEKHLNSDRISSALKPSE